MSELPHTLPVFINSFIEIHPCPSVNVLSVSTRAELSSWNRDYMGHEA